MACYFLIDTYIDEKRGRGEYDLYIEAVRPIVEHYGGEYLLRTEQVKGLTEERQPQRIIVIRFPSRAALDACFGSREYLDIAGKRAGWVDARAVIAEDTEDTGNTGNTGNTEDITDAEGKVKTEVV